MSKQHDQLEAPAAMEKRLGLTAKTRKAARAYSKRKYPTHTPLVAVVDDFAAGAAWERRRRNREGY